MSHRILNRNFTHPADGWYHLEPKGEHPNRAAGVVQVIDTEASTSIVAAFNREADQAGSNFPGMLIDEEHFKHQPDKSTRATGWLMRLQNRDDGYYGQIRWTASGKAAVDGGDLRFFSTEYEQSDLQVLNRKGQTARVRPLRLAGLTLTNSPNNRGGRPITNRHAAGATQAATPLKMKTIAARLSLSADASEESILSALDLLSNRATSAEGKVTALTTERDTLVNRLTTMEGTQADADLDAHGIKPDAADRADLRKLLLTNRDSTLALLKRLAPAKETKPALTNRAAASSPAGAATEDGPTEADVKRATAIHNRATSLQEKNPGWSLTHCYGEAQRMVANDAAQAAR